MLPRQMSRAAVIAGLVLSMSPANAQYYGDGCSSCGPVAARAVACTPIQPVQTTCYQQVPVTTMVSQKQTVQEPYYEKTFEEREYTVMKPVTTAREVEIPTVSYRNVTTQRTVQRDMGRWVTRYTAAQKCSPCQVDPRPGMIGWLNRTGYSFRSAFKPNYYTSRQYVPNRVACTVPVTRQVAVRGTRRVTVHDTKMVAERKTERVAVHKLRHRERVVTVMRPQTAYRTVPIGTRTAYGYGGYGLGTQAAFAPMIIDDTRRASLDPEPDPLSSRSADASRDKDMFARDPDKRQRAQDDDDFIRKSSHSHELEPVQPDHEEPFFNDAGAQRDRDQLIIPATYTKPAQPTAGGWRQSSRKTALRSSQQTASSMSEVTLTHNSEN